MQYKRWKSNSNYYCSVSRPDNLPLVMYPTSVSGLVALPFLTLALAANVITDDTHFYGQSEPVYPTRESILHPSEDID